MLFKKKKIYEPDKVEELKRTIETLQHIAERLQITAQEFEETIVELKEMQGRNSD